VSKRMDIMSQSEVNNYRKVYQFPNGYGASIVCHEFSYGHQNGLFEVAVLDKDGGLCYDTPITNDVLGHLDFWQVAMTLKQIESL